MSPGRREELSREMAGLLFSCPLYINAKKVFCYVSFRDEAETFHILEESLQRGKKTAVPKVLGKREMEFYYIQNLDQLTPGTFGIPEPAGPPAEEAVPAEDTLIIMPGSAFDCRGNRLGYGGGYYDTYLSRFPFCRRAALCFPEQLVPSVPAEPSDIPAEIIITGKEIIECLPDCQKIR